MLRRGGVVFAHADEPAACCVNAYIGVTQIHAFGRERFGRTVVSLAIESLVCEVDEEDCAIEDAVFAAAVLMDARARVEGLRRHVLRRAFGCASDNDVPARFLRSPFEPIDTCAVERGRAEAHRTADDQVRSDGRAPRAVGRNLWFSHAYLYLAP